MKFISIIFLCCLLISCTEENKKTHQERYIIETIVPVKQGSVEAVLELFKSTNPDLVKGESDWLRATFSVLEGENIVVVRAEWNSKASYQVFSNSDRFKTTMGQFGKYFEGRPEVTISKVLFEM